MFVTCISSLSIWIVKGNGLVASSAAAAAALLTVMLVGSVSETSVGALTATPFQKITVRPRRGRRELSRCSPA